MFCCTTRNGTAQTSEDSQLYKITKSSLDEVLTDFPSIRRKLIQLATTESKLLIDKRIEILKKNPMYGKSNRQKEALLSMRAVYKHIE